MHSSSFSSTTSSSKGKSGKGHHLQNKSPSSILNSSNSVDSDENSAHSINSDDIFPEDSNAFKQMQPKGPTPPPCRRLQVPRRRATISGAASDLPPTPAATGVVSATAEDHEYDEPDQNCNSIDKTFSDTDSGKGPSTTPPASTIPSPTVRGVLSSTLKRIEESRVTTDHQPHTAQFRTSSILTAALCSEPKSCLNESKHEDGVKSDLEPVPSLLTSSPHDVTPCMGKGTMNVPVVLEGKLKQLSVRQPFDAQTCDDDVKPPALPDKKQDIPPKIPARNHHPDIPPPLPLRSLHMLPVAPRVTPRGMFQQITFQ